MFDNPNISLLLENSQDITILYVEDEPEVQETVLNFLNIIFKNIHLASNGKEALEVFNQNQIDLVITDINMPVMNGLELLEELNKITNDIPTLIISAHSDQENMLSAIKLGVDGFILKPIEPDQFFDTLYNAVRKALLIRNNKKNLMILNQYKEITNRSSIISKTNASGVITFVNDNFCEISGYSREELIGKNHNIVRHPDNPKEVFERLWHTIKEKKEPWSGIIKNLSKERLR